MPEIATLEAAADALLWVIVMRRRERASAEPRKPIQATPFQPRDPSSIPTRDALDLQGILSDPIGTACRAELRRIGRALHAADPGRDFVDLAVEIAEMDSSHAGWRAIVLETAWAGIEQAAMPRQAVVGPDTTSPRPAPSRARPASPIPTPVQL